MVRRTSLIAAVWLVVVAFSSAAGSVWSPQHDLSVVAKNLPLVIDAGSMVSVPVQVTNNGPVPWSSEGGFLFSYHWLDSDGQPVIWDGRRTALPETIEPGASLEFEAVIEAPGQSGEFLLMWDLVHEGVLWVSEVDRTPIAPISVTIRTTRAFSILGGEPPRFMASGSDVVVEVEYRNDGVFAWPADGMVFASYRWLDLGGGRVSGQGHSVPLEGLRTSFQGDVAPGDRRVVRVVIEPPPRGGLYRLQMDVVEEYVCWFADRQPDPPPARFVLVVGDPRTSPGWWAFACLLAAAAAVTTLGKQGPKALLAAFAIADVVWLVGSLTLKQSFVLAQQRISPSPGAWVMMIAGAALLALVTRLLPGKFRGWACWTLVAAGTLVLWGDAVYLRFFGDLPGLAALSAVGQVGQVEASVRSLLVADDLWMWLDLLPGLVLIVVAGRIRQHQGPWLHRVLLVALIVSVVVGAVALHRLDERDGRRLRQVFYRVRVASKVGILNLHAIEAGRQALNAVARAGLSPEEEQEIVDWFRERAPSRAGVGPWFGAAEEMNLVMVQVESLQGFVVGLEIEGREVTPFLNQLRERGLWFSNFGDQTLDGRSSDSEFATQVSLLPSTGGAAAFLHADNEFTGLAEILAGRGYRTLSAVPFDGSFWNRRTTHQRYGFEQSLFTDAFSDGQKIGWGLNDRDFLHQMAGRLARMEQPFAAYLLTLSLHHPFEGFPEELRSLDLGRWEGTPFGNFLHTMHFFDQALAGFVADLEDAGLAENTVIALWGDHDAGFKWRPEIAELIGYPPNNIGWYLSQEVPFFLAVPGREDSGGERTISAGHIDVAPTLMALLGMDPTPYAFVGRNLLGEPGDFPVIGEFDCWRDSRRLFIRGGGALEDGQCVDATALTVLPVSECAAGFAEAGRSAVFSAAVLEHDLQREIHRRLTARKSPTE